MKHLKSYNESVGEVWPTSKLQYNDLCHELNCIGYELDDFDVFVHENPPYEMDYKSHPAEIRVTIYDNYDGKQRIFSYSEIEDTINRMIGYMVSENWELKSNKCINTQALTSRWRDVETCLTKDKIDRVVLTFVNNIKSYNEESIWNVFKTGKAKLYDKSSNLKKKSSNQPIYTFRSKKIEDTKFVNEYGSVSPTDYMGTFLIHRNNKDLSFRDRVYADELWFDAKPIFDRLHRINKELGYSIGTAVSSKNLKRDTKIVEVVDFAFYELYRSGFSSGCSISPVFTLLYRLEGDDHLYQVTTIDLLESSKVVDNIVDEVIKENFYDLIDDETIEYVSNEKVYKGIAHYECKIKIKSDITPDSLFRVSELLNIATKRLKDQSITLTIKGINTNEINFVCHYGKSDVI